MQGVKGGPSGDLLITIEEKEHEHFKRDGQNVIYDLFLNFADAALGTSVSVPTLNGIVKIKIPQGTQSGKLFRLRGKGFPSVQSYGKGDQIIHVNIWTPKKLNDQEKQLLHKMQELPNFKPNPGKSEKGFFEKMKDYFSLIKNKKSNSVVSGALIIALLTISCTQQVIYEEKYPIKDEQWLYQDSLLFFLGSYRYQPII